MQQLGIDALITQLQAFRARYGDLPVVLRDADTDWAFRLNVSQLSVDHDMGAFGTRLQIMARYGDDMEIPARVPGMASSRKATPVIDDATCESALVSES